MLCTRLAMVMICKPVQQKLKGRGNFVLRKFLLGKLFLSGESIYVLFLSGESIYVLFLSGECIYVLFLKMSVSMYYCS